MVWSVVLTMVWSEGLTSSQGLLPQPLGVELVAARRLSEPVQNQPFTLREETGEVLKPYKDNIRLVKDQIDAFAGHLLGWTPGSV